MQTADNILEILLLVCWSWQLAILVRMKRVWSWDTNFGSWEIQFGTLDSNFTGINIPNTVIPVW